MFMIFLVWSVYLLADWAAAFAVGLISNSQGEDSQPVDNGDLLAFWAPFLLVHLGGPDTITAFALEDNALWLRHLIGLLFQVFAAFYVFLQTLPDNKLLVPTILMLLAGIVKYAERTRALYLASLDKYKASMLKKPDPGPNYAKLMDEYASKKEANLPTRIDMIAEPKKDSSKTTAFDDFPRDLNVIDSVKYAYQFYEIFKGLIVDLIFSFHERNYSRSFFQSRTADDAYNVALIELNFMYEALYTKVVVVHSLVGYIFRFFALDLIAMFMVFFSDWNVANIKKLAKTDGSVGDFVDRCLRPILSSFLRRKIPRTSKIKLGEKESPKKNRCLSPILSSFLTRKTPRTSDIQLGDKESPEKKSGDKDNFVYEVFDTPVLCRRWAESISAHNLIGYCIKAKPRKICKPMGCFGWMVHIIGVVISSPFLIIVKLLQYLKLFFEKLDEYCCSHLGFIGSLYADAIWLFERIFMFVFDNLGLTEISEEMTYVSKNAFPKALWKYIFDELIVKASLADDPETAKIICEAKGDWVLQDNSFAIDHEKVSLMQYVKNVEYDQSILLWHIATDLCYYTEEENSLNEQNNEREFSKMLSDYMLYLLVRQPKMMSAVAGIGQIRFRDTHAEAKKFFDRGGLASVATEDEKMKKACKKVLDVNTDVRPIAVKGDRSKSVLFDASILAKELKKLDNQMDKWKVMCKVWVELLSYAASHCRADTHAHVLSKGGEFVTVVWLLMAHLGIGEQFQINEGHARAKLMVGK
ncbi:uncharacterized protein LOC116209132 [Punica granatum]|uniref:Uncharacterized protein LOC116209132 n=1 Tax=Punica granatum TaxID=22663 RepID=A0A218WXP6_PUNGR|nr:uncharacterized protein LOC116209132 [Punica granatum]OWM77567.1 hypothetical protein CDL15_Pgr016965 [Punica granatum]